MGEVGGGSGRFDRRREDSHDGVRRRSRRFSEGPPRNSKVARYDLGQMEISCVLTFVKGGAAAALRQLEERRIEGEREREREGEEDIGRRGAPTPAGV